MTEIVGLVREEAERLVRMSNSNALRPQNRTPEATEPPLEDRERWICKNSSSEIPARSGDTPGSGTVTIQKLDSGALTATNGTLTAYNFSASAIAADAYILVFRDEFGTDWVSSEDCG